MLPRTFEFVWGGRPFSIETGKFAKQADAAVTVRYGETIVLVTAGIAKEVREGVDFLPLTVDYEERLYAAGKIPGGFIRREGRPTAGSDTGEPPHRPAAAPTPTQDMAPRNSDNYHRPFRRPGKRPRHARGHRQFSSPGTI